MKNNVNIIGVTGNIATGKSVLRRMLANSGALGIDADELAHRMIYPQGPAYQSVVEAFGKNILTEEGSISHRKLGQIVFHDIEALLKLEGLIHPFVIEAIQARVNQSQYPIIVIEAIKLLEAGLGEICDSIWVSHASHELQLERLMTIRNMPIREAKQRIQTQSPQSKKIAQADIVINTEESFYSTWSQIQQALNDTIHVDIMVEPQNLKSFPYWSLQSARELTQGQLEAFWKTYTENGLSTLYEQLGSLMFLLLSHEGQLRAIINWENWNFAATLKNIITKSVIETSPRVIYEAFQKDARLKQSEILLINNEVASKLGLNPSNAGFEKHAIEQLVYPAWRQAANKISNDQETHLWVKKLSNPLENRKTIFVN